MQSKHQIRLIFFSETAKTFFLCTIKLKINDEQIAVIVQNRKKFSNSLTIQQLKQIFILNLTINSLNNGQNFRY